MVKKMKASSPGGIKGFLSRAGRSFYAGGIFAKEKSLWLSEKMLKVGFVIATTSLVVLMPLIFEIAREGQMIENERVVVKDLRSQGYSDRQLGEMGFCDTAVKRAPSVAVKNT
uniref:Mitochondrial import receptor subunit TOM22 homolog n=1 Tax=Eucampia antarctica TaxID=49252 RepID=A0A7S2SD82_9STRA|mmetsp:Transcript_5730/g.5356  ORF Transcript_5730/g.5356 Transcript_5730/m.5356 type:complete len:113 (+) Transcript_5730:141-479(+)